MIIIRVCMGGSNRYSFIYSWEIIGHYSSAAIERVTTYKMYDFLTQSYINITRYY